MFSPKDSCAFATSAFWRIAFAPLGWHLAGNCWPPSIHLQRAICPHSAKQLRGTAHAATPSWSSSNVSKHTSCNGHLPLSIPHERTSQIGTTQAPATRLSPAPCFHSRQALFSPRQCCNQPHPTPLIVSIASLQRIQIRQSSRPLPPKRRSISITRSRRGSGFLLVSLSKMSRRSTARVYLKDFRAETFPIKASDNPGTGGVTGNKSAFLDRSNHFV
jgi:hypothetical protein